LGSASGRFVDGVIGIATTVGRIGVRRPLRRTGGGDRADAGLYRELYRLHGEHFHEQLGGGTAALGYPVTKASASCRLVAPATNDRRGKEASRRPTGELLLHQDA
jgi:hypothetical protein